jgi:ribosomal protein L32
MKWVEASDYMRARWNNDHLPHREFWWADMKNVGLILVAVALIAGAIGIYTYNKKSQKESMDFPNGISFLCHDCNEGFFLPEEKLAEWQVANPGKPPACPKCGKYNTERARKCPSCGKFYTGRTETVNGRPVCPLCKKPFPEGAWPDP